MSITLPDFEVLREMAEQDPEGLERLRIELCDQLIQSAPAKYRRRLRGLQFRIDMERRRARTPMAACIAISAMMQESFYQLRLALHGATGNTTDTLGGSHDRLTEAKVLPFRRA